MSTLSAPALTDSLARYLSKRPATDLIARWSPNLETQINIRGPRGWEPVDGKNGYFTDGIREVGPLRIPSCPTAYYPLDDFAADIGTTGWDYAAKQSRFWGFDFDVLAGHADGLSVEDIDSIRLRAMDDPRCEVRRSTRGQGLHIYCHADDTFPAQDHHEHATYAKRILFRLAQDWGMPVGEQVDCQGSNMWFWSTRATAENQGLTLIRSHEQTWTLTDLPALPATSIENCPIETKRLPLDDKHRAIIKQLESSGYATRWNEEKGCLITHTVALAAIRHCGSFQTISDGQEPGKPNCYASPQHNGSFEVYRWREHPEHESWTVDDHVHTTYNRPLDFVSAARLLNLARSKGQKYSADLPSLDTLAAMMGLDYTSPKLAPRGVVIVQEKSSIIATMPRLPGDPETIASWVPIVSNRKDCWERAIDPVEVAKAPATKVKEEPQPECFRRCYHDSKDIGWFGLDADGKRWQPITRTDARAHAMAQLCLAGTEAEIVLSDATRASYEVVSEHFAPEYPRPRVWNHFGAQFSCPVADQDGAFEHFEKPLRQWGDYLTPYVRRLEWLTSRGIVTGRDYLFTYLAMILHNPTVRLPWIFAYGPQDSGKSTLFESWASLMTKGAKNIDRAFRPGCQFNYELWGVILGAVEETNLCARDPQVVHDIIKPLISGPAYKVEFKNKNSVDVSNCLHVIQTGNFPHYCPITERDDTRFVVVELPALGSKMIGKTEMEAAWKKEAPYFLRALTKFDLAPFEGGFGKLALPIIDTPAKAVVIDSVAQLMGRADDERPFASAMLAIEGQIVTLAQKRNLCGKTASEILAMLKLTGEAAKFITSANVLGSVLRYHDRTKLHVDHTRRNYHVTAVDHLRP